jgi:CheY-like chemotaxis protein
MSKRILVVEDEEDNRRIVRDLLTSVGYESFQSAPRHRLNQTTEDWYTS